LLVNSGLRFVDVFDFHSLPLALLSLRSIFRAARVALLRVTFGLPLPFQLDPRLDVSRSSIIVIFSCNYRRSRRCNSVLRAFRVPCLSSYLVTVLFVDEILSAPFDLIGGFHQL